MINESTKSVRSSAGKQLEWSNCETRVAALPATRPEVQSVGAAGAEMSRLHGWAQESEQRCSGLRGSIGPLEQQHVCRRRSSKGGGDKRYLHEDGSSYGVRFGGRRSAGSNSCTTSTNFLKPRMEFTGYQISGYKKYQVVISLKTVNLPQYGWTTRSPHVTGFLTIRGLTTQHPEITTFFEAFAVTHRELGFLSSGWPKESLMSSCRADDQTDLEHWLNFPAFKQLFLQESRDGGSPTLNDVVDGTCEFGNYLEQRYMFMRWKEKYLVPEDLTDVVEGASYDGFYYIVHDQVTGNVQGFYYHQDAEKFQQLELVPSVRMADECFSCDFEMA